MRLLRTANDEDRIPVALRTFPGWQRVRISIVSLPSWRTVPELGYRPVIGRWTGILVTTMTSQ